MSDAVAFGGVSVGPESVSIKSQWANNPMNVPTTVNQMLLQLGLPAGEDTPSDGVYLSFGHMQPPILPNPMTDEAKAVLQNTVFTVMPVATIFLTRDRLEQFNVLIADFLTKTAPKQS